MPASSSAPADATAEDAKAKGARLARRLALAKLKDSAKSREAQRKIVQERLSKPLLSQMFSSEFQHNPLADEEEVSDMVRKISKTLASVGELQRGASRLDAAAQERVQREAKAKQLQAWKAAAAGSRASATDKGLADLVALKSMVQAYDPHGDGLDTDEFVDALGSMWRECSPQELTRLFMQIDADSDGRVTWEELLTFLLQKNQAGDENEINRFDFDDDAPPPAPGVAHAEPISHLLSMADREKYLSVGRDATLRLWQSEGAPHVLARRVELPEKVWINAAAYCPTHKRVALATAHAKLLVYSADAMRLLRSWRTPMAGTAMCAVEAPELSSAWAGASSWATRRAARRFTTGPPSTGTRPSRGYATPSTPAGLRRSRTAARRAGCSRARRTGCSSCTRSACTAT